MKLKDILKSRALKSVLNEKLENIGTVEVLTINTKEQELFASFYIEELLPTKFSISAHYSKIFNEVLKLTDVKTSHNFIKEILKKRSIDEKDLAYTLPIEWISNL